jgi:hypothetical protein
MSAIERCRTAALGGHVMRCENDACGYTNGGAAGLPPVPHGLVPTPLKHWCFDLGPATAQP